MKIDNCLITIYFVLYIIRNTDCSGWDMMLSQHSVKIAIILQLLPPFLPPLLNMDRKWTGDDI